MKNLNIDIVNKLLNLKSKALHVRPLATDHSDEANNARSLAWLLFDNAELITDIIRPKDNCEICKGERGGMLGNENIIDGKKVCDYCTSDRL